MTVDAPILSVTRQLVEEWNAVVEVYADDTFAVEVHYGARPPYWAYTPQNWRWCAWGHGQVHPEAPQGSAPWGWLPWVASVTRGAPTFAEELERVLRETLDAARAKRANEEALALTVELTLDRVTRA